NEPLERATHLGFGEPPRSLPEDLRETLVGHSRPGFHDRWGPCPTHTTWIAAIFASVAASPDAINGSVSASGPIRAMSFVVLKSPLGFVTDAGQGIGIKSQRRSSKGASGENTTICARIGPTSNLG